MIMNNRRRVMTVLGIFTGAAAAMLLLQRWNRRFMLKQVCNQKVWDENGQTMPGKKVVVAVALDAPIERAWQMVLTGGLLDYLARPWLTFKSQTGVSLPDVWQQGETVTLNLFLFNFIPLGTHTIFIERLDGKTYYMETREHNALFDTWDHTIQLQESSDNKVLYSDEIVLHARRWNRALAWLVDGFFQYRQVRLQELVRRL